MILKSGSGDDDDDDGGGKTNVPQPVVIRIYLGYDIPASGRAEPFSFTTTTITIPPPPPPPPRSSLIVLTTAPFVLRGRNVVKDPSTFMDVGQSCCSGADVCLDCWPLMTVAIKVIDAALREDFGFNHILWVFSGRRGVHCWVCDGKARRLTNEQRAAIADYFRVYKGNENSGKKVSLAGPVLHPFLVRSYAEFLKDFFETKLLSSQNLLLTEERYEKILEMIPDNSVTSELRGKWQQNTRRSSAPKEDINLVRWAQLKSTLQSGKQKVSKHMNHLLKAPFCVHPKTGGYLDVLSVLEMNASAMEVGRVCVPIDPDNCDEFDPTRVPMLSQLLGELNIEGRTTDDGNVWDGTSLGKSISFFRSSFLQPLLKSCKHVLSYGGICLALQRLLLLVV
ncbi:hypothetical protein Tsubulata_001823 [Turnera subulata]|uniref:DNA primase n=1 Tax=Turnera subulata TaxID=218843 RepID=A0A9Q0G544_9ROSI|nr:hypothetical protein Tsubulata_001823 [Turnera subulata]